MLISNLHYPELKYPKNLREKAEMVFVGIHHSSLFEISFEIQLGQYYYNYNTVVLLSYATRGICHSSPLPVIPSPNFVFFPLFAGRPIMGRPAI